MIQTFIRYLCRMLPVMAWLGMTSAFAADNSALARDLTASITLLGLPCGQVVSVSPQGERDNLVTCSDGNRYRVYVNAQGLVAAEKR